MLELRLLIGAHMCGLEHLRRQLEANRPLLEQAGTLLPDRATAGQALAVALKSIRRGLANDQTGPNFISHLTDDTACARVLLIDPDISGSILRPTKNGNFYPRANSTTFQLIRQLEDVAQVRLYFATRNPATLLPACYGASLRWQPNVSFEDYVSASNPHDLRWSEYLHRVQGTDAEVPVTIWSWEDYPCLWREAAQAYAGIENKEALVDADGGEQPEMSVKGAMLMHAYLQDHPPKDDVAFDKVVTKFTEKFPARSSPAAGDAWSEDLVTALTEAYSDDLYYIDRMDNITSIRREEYL